MEGYAAMRGSRRECLRSKTRSRQKSCTEHERDFAVELARDVEQVGRRHEAVRGLRKKQAGAVAGAWG